MVIDSLSSFLHLYFKSKYDDTIMVFLQIHNNTESSVLEP